MSAGLRVSRDSESFRIELQDDADASVLREFGPYIMVQDAYCISCQPDPAGIEAIEIDTVAKRYGLRFFDDTSHWRGASDLRHGRFAPIELEADIYSAAGFEFELPPLHKRPWPILLKNGSYDIGEQVMITFAERVNDEIDFCAIAPVDAMKAQLRKLPNQLRRHLPYGFGESLITEWMAKIRLRSAG